MPGRIIAYSGIVPLFATRPGTAATYYADWEIAGGFGQGGVGAPPSATSCVFGGQGGVGAPPSATRVRAAGSFGQGGVGAPPSATSCVLGGQGGVGAPPSAILKQFTFECTAEAPALYVTSDNAATLRHTPTTSTLLFTFISFSSLDLKKRPVDHPARFSKHAPRRGVADRYLWGQVLLKLSGTNHGRLATQNIGCLGNDDRRGTERNSKPEKTPLIFATGHRYPTRHSYVPSNGCLFKERRLLVRYSHTRNRARCFHAPESAEEINGPRTEPRVVVVGKCQNHDAPLLDFLEKTDPLRKVTLAINNHLVPGCRFFLDPFPVPQPANVSEIRGNQIKLLF